MAVMTNCARAFRPSSVVASQRFAASSYTSDATRAPKVMSRRSSNLSAT